MRSEVLRFLHRGKEETNIALQNQTIQNENIILAICVCIWISQDCSTLFINLKLSYGQKGKPSEVRKVKDINLDSLGVRANCLLQKVESERKQADTCFDFKAFKIKCEINVSFSIVAPLHRALVSFSFKHFLLFLLYCYTCFEY